MRGLLVGRFQPFHKGHLALLETARAERPREPILVAVGSAQLSHTPLNPFTAGERIEMIEAAVAEAELTEVHVYPVIDIDRHALWVAHLRASLPKFGRVYTNNPLTKMLFEDARFRVETPTLVERARFQGIEIRRRLSSGEAWKSLVPPAVSRLLQEIRAPERCRQLVAAGPDVTPEHPK